MFTAFMAIGATLFVAELDIWVTYISAGTRSSKIVKLQKQRKER